MKWLLLQHLCVVAIGNGAFRSPSTKVANFTNFTISIYMINLFPTFKFVRWNSSIYIYIYIYIYMRVCMCEKNVVQLEHWQRIQKWYFVFISERLWNNEEISFLNSLSVFNWSTFLLIFSHLIGFTESTISPNIYIYIYILKESERERVREREREREREKERDLNQWITNVLAQNVFFRIDSPEC